MNADKPSYKTIGVPEIDQNPLVAHLQLPPDTDKDAYLSLALKPQFSETERELPTSIRRLKINQLRKFYAPILPAQRRALIGISSQVFDGYLSRNPLTAEGQRFLHGGPASSSVRPTISFIAGHSGMGKSTLIDRIVTHLGDQVVHHNSFHGVKFPESQILWLRRNVPEHCTVRTLCSTFGDYTDIVLGTSLYRGLFASFRGKGADRNLFLAEIRKIITNHHVGLLILDEFQNLSLMGVGAQKIIAFLVNLRDELGLPIVVVGTYKSLRLLESNLSTARRLVEGGYFDLERPTSAADPSWQQLTKIAWRYQWTREHAPYSSNIAEALYEVSQGITGIMLSSLMSSQLAAIENGTERVDSDLILKVFNERMKPLHPAVRALKSANINLIDKFDDIYRNYLPGTERIIDRPYLESRPSPPPLCEPIEPDAPSAAAKPIRSRKPVLSPERIAEMVLTGSDTNLSSFFEK